MSIEYVLDVRHDRGRPDRFCPRIRCDGCGEVIEGGAGNVYWVFVDEAQAVAGVAPTFMHKQCPDGQHREPPRPRPEWLWEDLDRFLVHLVENTGVDYVRALRRDRSFASVGL